MEIFDGEYDREIDSTYFNGDLDDNINIIESYILSTQSICPPLWFSWEIMCPSTFRWNRSIHIKEVKHGKRITFYIDDIAYIPRRKRSWNCTMENKQWLVDRGAKKCQILASSAVLCAEAQMIR